MKARIPNQFSIRQQKVMNEFCKEQISYQVVLAQWLMLIAFNDELGIGKDRFMRVMNRYEQVTSDFEQHVKDGTINQVLTKRLAQMGISVDDKLRKVVTDAGTAENPGSDT